MTYWAEVALGDLLRHRKEFFTIDELATYKRCRVQLHAQGVILRDRITGAEIKTKTQQACRAGEFLVAEIDAKVGGYGIVPDDLDGAIVSGHYFLFQIDDRKLDRRFLHYFCRTPGFQEQITAKGTTNYAAIRPGDVLNYRIALPPLDEQRRIVARIEELAAKIEEARGLRREVMAQTEGLVLTSGRQVLAAVRAETTKLRDWLDPEHAVIQTGPFGAQLGASDFVESGRPIITIGNVQYGGLDMTNLRHVSEDKARQLAQYSVRSEDILFARMGTVGRCCVVPKYAEGWLFNYHLIRVSLDRHRVIPRFVHWTIRASADVERHLGGTIRGATRAGVNSKIVGSLPCRIPAIDGQRRIVAHLDALQARVDTLKRLQAETAAELDALLPSILDKAFRGELA